MMQDDSADVTGSTASPDEPTNSDSTKRSSPLTSQPLSRRTLLKGTASAAISVTGLAAVSGTAAAGSFGYECHHEPAQAPSWFGYLDPWSQSEHNLPNASNGLTIYIHGFQTGRQGAIDDGHEVWRHLRDLGYEGSSFSFIWPSGSSVTDWGTALENCDMVGTWLADYLHGRGWTGNNDKRVNLVCHSLGAKVALECLDYLAGVHNDWIDIVHFLGGAVYDRNVGGGYKPGIQQGCWHLHNWHSKDDPVLRDVYREIMDGKWPVGYKGIATGPKPDNYTDHATGMKQHCQYIDYKYGVVDDLAPTMLGLHQSK
ncbi:alpha/beta hydrolase [Halocatena salina]|uniref:Alpha/beta hydrolase n=1 Tax=Halocatena salina TaxID=2934340 RepID=A0A8U0A8M8_9EURY|nr:alpha/beta hydrolase [Halocatena salina]UPM45209.1 alpha/beta hydrolase [Halocatena salina]